MKLLEILQDLKEKTDKGEIPESVGYTLNPMRLIIEGFRDHITIEQVKSNSFSTRYSECVMIYIGENSAEVGDNHTTREATILELVNGIVNSIMEIRYEEQINQILEMEL